MSKILVVDLTECRVLPRWHDKVSRRIIPIVQGEHYKEYDVLHGLLTLEENAALRSAGAEMAQERVPFPISDKAKKMPVGFNLSDMPEGAKIYHIDQSELNKEPT